MSSKRDTADDVTVTSLDEESAELRHLYQTAPVGLCLLDLDLRFVHVNESMAQINGKPVDAHIGKTLGEVVPEIAEMVEPIYRRVIATGEPALDFEVAGTTAAEPDRQKHWLVSYIPVRSAAGEVTGVSTVVQDITERKGLEQALFEGEARLRHLLESTRAVPWQADARTWQFTYVGPQAEKLLGYPSEAWLEENFWPEHIHPEDREAALTICNASMRTCSEYDLEYRMIAADGQVVWVQDIVSVTSIDGEPVTLRGFLIDVTDRKRTEAELVRSRTQLRLVADSLPVLIAFVGSDRRYRFTNREYSSWTGLSTEELDGRTVREVLGEATYTMLEPYIDVALSGRKVDHQSVMTRGDGEQRQVESSYVPHTDRQGNVVGFFALIRDVTERLQAEEDARRRREELAHVSRKVTLGELSASLAHELNQPLCAVVSNAQAAQRLLAGDPPDIENTEAALRSIVRDGKRAGDVIVRLRELLANREPEKRSIDVNGVVDDVLRLASRDLADREVEAQTRLDRALPRVMADRVQLQQVLLNLILNAADAMTELEPGERRLTIRTGPGENGGVEVAVEDVGHGIDEDTRELVFEPFFTTKSHGMGMGLAISRSIVEAHGGKLWTCPDTGSGATFRFTLPGVPDGR
jgi:PAS domain S-box-containing protein